MPLKIYELRLKLGLCHETNNSTDSRKKCSNIQPELCQKFVDDYQKSLVEEQLAKRHITKF